jgi:hypothetical protein
MPYAPTETPGFWVALAIASLPGMTIKRTLVPER